MADTQDDFQNEENVGVFDRIKESPRTVSALIIILIVAAAIYAFSGDQRTDTTPAGDTAPETSDQAENTTNPEEGDEEESTEGEIAAATIAPVPSPAIPLTQEQLSESARQLPEARRTDTAYVEVAQAGDGVTHLARRATTRWLSENQAGFEVTNEHRIYIEDYIKDHVGRQPLGVGQEQEISIDLIQEAVASAQQLNEQQLRNLSRYTAALS